MDSRAPNIEIDQKDLKILEILKENSSLSVRQIASRTLLPITTVHHRIKRLKSLGVIKRYTIEVNHKTLGKGLSAYVLIKVDSKYLKNMRISQHDLASSLKKFDFVERADIVTGAIDIVALIRVKDVEELDRIIIDKLRDIQGIESTETLVILRETE
ncbi:MAG: Lrp/AsnC family transcriptional regulator [Candidatus Aenigmatarchaeota archaeon]